MMNKQRLEEAKKHFYKFLNEGLIKEEENELALATYIKNSDLSIKVAEKLIADLELKPYLWVVVTSYYSMFYMANAVLLTLGYKIGDENVHRVTNEALIALVFDKLKKGLLEEYQDIMKDALEIANTKAEEIIENQKNNVPPTLKSVGLIGTCFLDDPKLKPVLSYVHTINGVV